MTEHVGTFRTADGLAPPLHRLAGGDHVLGDLGRTATEGLVGAWPEARRPRP